MVNADVTEARVGAMNGKLIIVTSEIEIFGAAEESEAKERCGTLSNKFWTNLEN